MQQGLATVERRGGKASSKTQTTAHQKQQQRQPRLAHHRVPRRDELPPRPGRGWCVGPDGAEPLQVFLPPGPQ